MHSHKIIQRTSTDPAPNPRGIENSNKKIKEFDNPNPIKARAVIDTLIKVTILVPNFLINLTLKKLDITVPAAIIIEIIPAYETPTDKSLYIAGQADPSSESGKPRLIKEI